MKKGMCLGMCRCVHFGIILKKCKRESKQIYGYYQV